MAMHIRRREFIVTLGGAVVAWPLAARGQAGKLPTVGILGSSLAAFSYWLPALLQRLRELGWIENRTMAIEYRWTDGRNERYAQLAAELVPLTVDVFVPRGPPPIAPPKQPPAFIPTVFPPAPAPVGDGP